MTVNSSSRALLTIVAMTAAASISVAALAQAPTPPGVDRQTHAAHRKKDPAAHAAAAPATDPGDLAVQLLVLRDQVARLEAMLAQRQSPAPAPQAAAGGRSSMAMGSPMGAAVQPPTGAMTGMAGSRRAPVGAGSMPSGGMMDRDQMMKGKMSPGAAAMGMDGMMAMMGMGTMEGMAMGGGPAAKLLPSDLPGFPGSSHLYHVGATGFFLDHPEHVTLTREQSMALARRKEQTLLRQAELQRTIDQAEQDLWVLTAADQPDAAAIERKVEAIAKLHGEQRLAFIQAVGAAAKVLTDDQRMQLVGALPPASTPPAGDAPMPMGGAMGDM